MIHMNSTQTLICPNAASHKSRESCLERSSRIDMPIAQTVPCTALQTGPLQMFLISATCVPPRHVPSAQARAPLLLIVHLQSLYRLRPPILFPLFGQLQVFPHSLQLPSLRRSYSDTAQLRGADRTDAPRQLGRFACNGSPILPGECRRRKGLAQAP